jgi:hypothetical protein
MSIQRLGWPKEKVSLLILCRQRIIKVDVEICGTLFREMHGDHLSGQEVESAVMTKVKNCAVPVCALAHPKRRTTVFLQKKMGKVNGSHVGQADAYFFVEAPC